jgi:hypothetical protein
MLPFSAINEPKQDATGNAMTCKPSAAGKSKMHGNVPYACVTAALEGKEKQP